MVLLGMLILISVVVSKLLDKLHSKYFNEEEDEEETKKVDMNRPSLRDRLRQCCSRRQKDPENGQISSDTNARLETGGARGDKKNKNLSSVAEQHEKSTGSGEVADKKKLEVSGAGAHSSKFREQILSGAFGLRAEALRSKGQGAEASGTTYSKYQDSSGSSRDLANDLAYMSNLEEVSPSWERSDKVCRPESTRGMRTAMTSSQVKDFRQNAVARCKSSTLPRGKPQMSTVSNFTANTVHSRCHTAEAVAESEPARKPARPSLQSIVRIYRQPLLRKPLKA